LTNFIVPFHIWNRPVSPPVIFVEYKFLCGLVTSGIVVESLYVEISFEEFPGNN